MSQYAPIPARAVRRQTAPVIATRSRFRWQGRRGSLTALTGQVGVLARSSTGTAVDSNGTTYTAVHTAPRWEARDFAGTGTRRELGIRLAADDLAWTFNGTPETGTFFFEGVEAGTVGTANAGLLYLGNDAVSGARILLDSDGSTYRATIHNGTTSASVSLASAIPTSGQAFRGAVQLQDDGTNWSIRLWMDVLTVSGEEITAWSSTITRAATWGATTKIRANRTGSAGTQGSTWLRQVAWDAGLLTLDEAGARL